MITYSQSLGYNFFDWNTALDTSIENFERWNELSRKASFWISCPVSNTASLIARNLFGQPRDSKLSDLGFSFGDLIEEMMLISDSYSESPSTEQLPQFVQKRELAKELLRQIKEREQELIPTLYPCEGKKSI